ncbi:Small ubiquitin-related modifier SUMO [Neofusicoccum parvum]|uniref:Small ubiquitin-related modifier SUMO n=1 Tax=Neofusicoccum parvum TaxID=310453 RepID=A0ACB5S6I9_9PEZI|nr:Small ubiquitin-related modifier SUMO [Neofusicoccum parvum]
MADSASAASGAPPKQKRSFFKKPSWKQKLDNADDDDPTAMFDGSRQTFSAIMEEQERARKKKLQEQEEQARRKELGAARQGKRRKVVRDEDHHSSGEDSAPAGRDDRKELRQRLQEVREAWCKRQGFNEEMTDSVFFTFKGRRLFDVATCTSLGLVADGFGNVYMKDNREWDENDGRITVEAVTLDIYNEDMREMKRQREVEPAPEPEPEPEPEPKRIKIIIKTKDFGDAKFTCGPETTFEKLTGSSMLKLKLSADKRPYLLFDGERLDPTGTMADLDDFEDGDALEMHFD